MEQKLVNFFRKQKINPTDILHLTKGDRHTIVTLKNGQQLKTTIPQKYFLQALPEGGYLHITKGVIVASSEIVSIEGNIYTMSDGSQFSGRVRTSGAHKQNKLKLEKTEPQKKQLISETIFQRFSIMDKLHLPFAVVELVFAEDNHTLDFIVRYCNEAMAKYQGLPREEMLDQPFAPLTHSAYRHWTLVYTEVAMIGTSQTIDWVHPLTGNPHTIHCFQPAKGFCACLLTETEK